MGQQFDENELNQYGGYNQSYYSDYLANSQYGPVDPATPHSFSDAALVNLFAATASSRSLNLHEYVYMQQFDATDQARNWLQAEYRSRVLEASAVPEPASIALLGAGFLAAVAVERRRRV